MSKTKPPPSFDGATLSRRIEPKSGVDVGLPLGKQEVKVDGKKVARHYKHAAGKSSTYAPPVVDMIYHMSRSGALSDADAREFVAAKLQAEREIPAKELPPTFDQLLFLPANLTRLVIDPYREKCNTQVQVGTQRAAPLTLDWPIVFGGADFRRLPGELFACVRQAAVQARLAVFATVDQDSDPQDNPASVLMVDVDAPRLDVSHAAAIEITAPSASMLDRDTIAPVLDQLRRATGDRIPIGIAAPAFGAATVVDQTINLDVDFYVADAQWTADARPSEVFPELSAAPHIAVIADVMDRLRHHCREAAVQLVYRGGIRGGADAAKVICLGAAAVSLGLSAALAMATRINQIKGEQVLLDTLAAPMDPPQTIGQAVNFAKSVNMEVAMLARACGKSDVRNMEPEDLRAISIAVSAATGIPVAGKDYNFRPGSGNE